MTQMMTTQAKINNVRKLLESLKPQIALALPKHMTADRMSRVAMTCVLRTPKLLECDQTSLAGAIVTCSQLGLEPDPMLGHAHLVPFYNSKARRYEVVVIPGYKGLMKLARNSGLVSTIDAHVVHTRDTFAYAYGLTPQLRHVPYQGPEDAGPATHYYAVCRLRDGGHVFTVMTKAEVERHRDRFVKNVREDSTWITDFDAMAIKTAIRMLAKFMPASVELQRAAALDERVEAGVSQDLGDVIDVSGVVVEDAGAPNGDASAAGSKLDALADKLAAEHQAPATAEAEAEAPLESRAELLGLLDQERQRLGYTEAAWWQTCRDHVHTTVLDTADVAALSDFLIWLRKQ